MVIIFKVFRKPIQLNVDNADAIRKACVYLSNYFRKRKTSTSIYTTSGNFDVENLENEIIVPRAWRPIIQNDTELTTIDRVP
nr:unnamed protein product [Callosobruchus analis]